MSILVVAAGTTGVTASVVSDTGHPTTPPTETHRALRALRPQVSGPRRVEQVPEEIWRSVCAAVLDCLAAEAGSGDDLTGIEVIPQPDTVLLWDPETNGSPRAAILSEDRRGEDSCTRLLGAGHLERVAELTGRIPLAGSTATKLAWLAENEPNTWALVDGGRYAIGAVEAYLVTRMTRGTWHVTDAARARDTLLVAPEIEPHVWSRELCDLFAVPGDALPEIVPRWRGITTDPRSLLGLEVPIRA